MHAHARRGQDQLQTVRVHLGDALREGVVTTLGIAAAKDGMWQLLGKQAGELGKPRSQCFRDATSALQQNDGRGNLRQGGGEGGRKHGWGQHD